MATADGMATGTAFVDERELVKAMSWWDGFMIALANPGFLLAALGGSIGALGTLGAMVIWTISVSLGALQNNISAELATMFPNKSGGISVFAHEGWRKYFSLVGPISTFGYWFAWSTVLSISGLIAGTLLQAQFFSGATWSVSGGHFHLDWPVLIAIALLLLVYFANARGIRGTVVFSYVTGILLLLPCLVLMIGPYISGAFHGGNLDWNIGSGGGIALVITWLYFMGWSSYGFEACATVAPEYRDTATDTPKALRASALFSILVYALLPLGLGGTLTTTQVANDPTAIAFYKTGFDAIGGNAFGGVLVVCLVCGIVLTMSTATLDGSRALYGISKAGMTVKVLAKLNKHDVPERGMFVDAALNIFLVVFFGTAIEILAAGNLGYILAHVFALSGFLLLRKDRPNWPRPIKLSAIWVPIAAFLCLANLAFAVLGGFVWADQYGYGLSKTLIGVGVLCVSILLYVYRRKVEDKLPLHFREKTPTVPEEEPALVAARAGLSATATAQTVGDGARRSPGPIASEALGRRPTEC
jgi:amino acid transporter